MISLVSLMGIFIYSFLLVLVYKKYHSIQACENKMKTLKALSNISVEYPVTIEVDNVTNKINSIIKRKCKLNSRTTKITAMKDNKDKNIYLVSEQVDFNSTYTNFILILRDLSKIIHRIEKISLDANNSPSINIKIKYTILAKEA